MKLFFTTFILTLALTVSARAASISVDTIAQTSVGKRISVAVIADLGSENINSAAVSLVYPADIIRFDGYDKDQGVLPLWVLPPTAEAGVVHFSGVVPGGINRLYDPEHLESQKVVLAHLFFVVEANGTGLFRITESQLLKNDGRGTSIPLETVPQELTVKGAAQTIDGAPGDIAPPLPFKVQLVEKSVFGKTPTLALFEAVDTEGGIEHYEIRVNRGKWHVAQSPYPLDYHLFSYTLTVRAFDFSGNYKDQSITISGEDPTHMVFLSVLLVVVLVFFRYKSQKKLRV